MTGQAELRVILVALSLRPQNAINCKDVRPTSRFSDFVAAVGYHIPVSLQADMRRSRG